MIPAMRRLVLLLLLASCGTPAGLANGRWFGAMTPDPAAPGCPPGRASLVATRNGVLFTPNEGTRTLEGASVPQDGTIAAERTTTGTDKKPYVTRLAARLADSAVTGTYTTPRCSYAVKLTRP